MPITVTLADDLAHRLQPHETRIAEILTLGIREWQARDEIGYTGVNSVLEKLATLPTPEEVLALRPSQALQQRIDALLEKNRAAAWMPEDQREWEQIEYLEHLVRLSKAAARKLMEAKVA